MNSCHTDGRSKPLRRSAAGHARTVRDEPKYRSAAAAARTAARAGRDMTAARVGRDMTAARAGRDMTSTFRECISEFCWACHQSKGDSTVGPKNGRADGFPSPGDGRWGAGGVPAAHGSGRGAAVSRAGAAVASGRARVAPPLLSRRPTRGRPRGCNVQRAGGAQRQARALARALRGALPCWQDAGRGNVWQGAHAPQRRPSRAKGSGRVAVVGEARNTRAHRRTASMRPCVCVCVRVCVCLAGCVGARCSVV